MQDEQAVTKILIVDEDDSSFEFCRTLAEKLEELPPLELFHARDATEALSLLERIALDVLVIGDENPAESELLMDTLDARSMPIVFCAQNVDNAIKMLIDANHVTCIQRSESIEGLHQTLRIAAALGMQAVVEKSSSLIH